jgi:hypothetical protein
MCLDMDDLEVEESSRLESFQMGRKVYKCQIWKCNGRSRLGHTTSRPLDKCTQNTEHYDMYSALNASCGGRDINSE